MKKKLKLSDLKVESFVTELNTEKIIGGAITVNGCLTGTETYYFPCTHGGGCENSNPATCIGLAANLSEVNCHSGLLSPCLTGTETQSFPC
jgi:hypothetical protein